jgi:hypothetical protein
MGSLRSAAARLLIERGHDVVAHCNAVLNAGELTAKQVRAALSFLADQHAPEIVPALTKYASDARADIRAHAVALQAKFLPSHKDELASRALLDPSRKVRKTGVHLCAGGAFVSLELVKTMLVQHKDCRAALAICARDKWDRLTCIALITELHAPAEDDCPDVKEVLRRWIEDPTSSWTKPRGEQRLILSRPETRLRLLDLADDRKPKLLARLREVGIEF